MGYVGRHWQKKTGRNERKWKSSYRLHLSHNYRKYRCLNHHRTIWDIATSLHRHLIVVKSQFNCIDVWCSACVETCHYNITATLLRIKHISIKNYGFTRTLSIWNNSWCQSFYVITPIMTQLWRHTDPSSRASVNAGRCANFDQRASEDEQKVR